jgi:hypothetical protein
MFPSDVLAGLEAERAQLQILHEWVGALSPCLHSLSLSWWPLS